MDKLSCYIYTGRLRYIRDLVAVWILHIGIYIFFPRPLDTYVHVRSLNSNFFVSFEKEKKGEPKRFLYRESIDEFRKIPPSFFPFYSSNERTTILNITSVDRSRLYLRLSLDCPGKFDILLEVETRRRSRGGGVVHFPRKFIREILYIACRYINIYIYIRTHLYISDRESYLQYVHDRNR